MAKSFHMWKPARSVHRLITLFMSGGRTKRLLSETNKWAESGGWRLSVYCPSQGRSGSPLTQIGLGANQTSLFTSVETAVSDSGVNHQVQMVSLFTWGWLVRAQVRGRLVDEWPRPEDAPPLHGAPRSVSYVHAAAGRADAHVWPGAVEPAPAQWRQRAYLTDDPVSVSVCLCLCVYLRCCFGELCGVLDGVDWAEEELRSSSLDSMLWICSFCTVPRTRKSVNWKQALESAGGTYKSLAKGLVLYVLAVSYM